MAEQTRSRRAGMPLRHFSASLPMKLLRAREAIMGRFRLMLRENGLTEQQWRVLRALSAAERMDVSQVAGATFLLGPSLTRILRDLAAQGLIATEADPRDQRRKLVRLAPTGLARIETVAPLSEEIYAEIARLFGRDRLVELQRLLDELESRLTAAEAPDGLDRSAQIA